MYILSVSTVLSRRRFALRCVSNTMYGKWASERVSDAFREKAIAYTNMVYDDMFRNHTAYGQWCKRKVGEIK